MNLENMLSEKSVLQKIAYCLIHSYEISRISKSTEAKSRVLVAQGWEGQGEGGIQSDC